MNMRRQSKQDGLSLIGLIFCLVIFGAIAILAAKVVPSVTEYLSIKKAVVTAKSAGTTPREIRSSFDKQVAAGYITAISGKDLDITPNSSGGVDVSFAYEQKIPLFGPASLVLDYTGSTAKESGNSAQ
jgi:type II secretory pathway pseudopilin PulG